MTGRSNCLLWALLLYLRRRAYGLRVVSYVPRDPRIKDCPPPCFTGRGKWGDL